MRISRTLIGLCILGMASFANAQATRTWVSGVGDDANPCSRTAPCKTFAGAISKTAPGGEIDAIDPGGFGTVTITKSITIDGAGTMASILAAGTNGVNVNDASSGAPGTIEVTLRNLSINGAGTGINGVNYSSGKRLSIENCVIFGFTGTGLNVTNNVANSFLAIRNSTFEQTTGIGINVSPTVGPMTVNMNDVRQFRSISNSGLFLNGNIKASVADSEFSGNPSGGGVVIAGTATVGLDHIRATGNNYGVYNQGGSPTTHINNSVLTGNSINDILVSVGTLTGYQSNVAPSRSGGTSTAPF